MLSGHCHTLRVLPAVAHGDIHSHWLPTLPRAQKQVSWAQFCVHRAREGDFPAEPLAGSRQDVRQCLLNRRVAKVKVVARATQEVLLSFGSRRNASPFQVNFGSEDVLGRLFPVSGGDPRTNPRVSGTRGKQHHRTPYTRWGHQATTSSQGCTPRMG